MIYNSKEKIKEIKFFEDEYYFISDSVLTQFESVDFDNKIILDFFNKELSKKYMQKDDKIDTTLDIKTTNILHLSQVNDKVNSIHIWLYQFYSTEKVNLNGFGWTPGQPQIGYIYSKPKKIPKEIIGVVKKIKFKIIKKIIVKKTIIYSLPDISTKMYLLKNDEVELLEEKDEWLKIRYYGKKIIEGWIKKSDVEMN